MVKLKDNCQKGAIGIKGDVMITTNRNYATVEFFCYKGNSHTISYPLTGLRNGLPPELEVEVASGYSSVRLKNDEPECCWMPPDMELRILRTLHNYGIEYFRSLGKIIVDASDYRKV